MRILLNAWAVDVIMDHQSPTLRARNVPRWKRGAPYIISGTISGMYSYRCGVKFYPRKFGKADIPMALAPMLENQVSSTI